MSLLTALFLNVNLSIAIGRTLPNNNSEVKIFYRHLIEGILMLRMESRASWILYGSGRSANLWINCERILINYSKSFQNLNTFLDNKLIFKALFSAIHKYKILNFLKVFIESPFLTFTQSYYINAFDLIPYLPTYFFSIRF